MYLSAEYTEGTAVTLPGSIPFSSAPLYQDIPFHASSILWGNQSARVSLSFHLPSWTSTSVLFNTRYSLQVETTEQLLAYFLQAFKAWHFFHGLPKHFPANILWKLFFSFLLQWREPFLLTVSSSWSMIHNKKSSTCPHWPYATGAHREDSWPYGGILAENKVGQQILFPV